LAQRDLLDDLELPEAQLYDLNHAMHLALERHDRARAVAHYEAMAAADTGHRLTLLARRMLAAYDDNPHEGLAATDALLSLFPHDQRLHLDRLTFLRRLATRDDRLAWLKGICERPGSDPLLWVAYAAELRADARQADTALAYLRRASRLRPDHPRVINEIA